MQQYILLLAFLINTISLISQENYFPPKGSWEVKTPSVFGINNEKILSAIKYAEDNQNDGDYDLRVEILKGFSSEPYHEILGPTKKRGSSNGLIIKNGYIIASWGDIDRVDMTFSVTKSYLSAITGIAIKKGLISSEKDKVSNYIWDKTFDGNKNKKITWEHLLNQSSNWAGTLWGINDWEDRPNQRLNIDSWRSQEQKEPGSYYKYNDVRVNVLAYSLLHVFRESLPKVLQQNIMNQIGASDSWRWYGYENSWTNIDGHMIQSVSGGGHNGGGVFINSLDHARFGLLYLNNGNWNGKTILTKEWIDKSIFPSPSNLEYGYMWWLNKRKGEDYWKEVPENVYYGSGFGGNYIVIIPDNKIVIVARWMGRGTIGKFVKMIIEADSN
ncbi:MAG: serine hydrolase [Bacteroidota bacterium]|nr:serine hydrolase [Bacteroidota bacterium]